MRAGSWPGTPLVSLLALMTANACQTVDGGAPGPDWTADADPEQSFVAAFEHFCLEPLPGADRMRARLAATGWSGVPGPELSGLAVFGHDDMVIHRAGPIGGLTISVAILQGRQLGAQLTACTLRASGVDAERLEALLRDAGHIQGAPVAEMDFGTRAFRSWYLEDAPSVMPRFGVAIETSAPDNTVKLTVNQ